MSPGPSRPGAGSAGARLRLRLLANCAFGQRFLANSPSWPGSARPRPGVPPLAPCPPLDAADLCHSPRCAVPAHSRGRDSAAAQPVRCRWGSTSRRLGRGAESLGFRSPVTSSGAEGARLVHVGSGEPREPHRRPVRWGGPDRLTRLGNRVCAAGHVGEDKLDSCLQQSRSPHCRHFLSLAWDLIGGPSTLPTFPLLSSPTFAIGDPVSLSFFPAIQRCYSPVNVEQIFIKLAQGCPFSGILSEHGQK